MADFAPGTLGVALGRRLERRHTLRALAALLAGGAFAERLAEPSFARARHHGTPRKRLRRRCRRQCRRVRNDCLHNCRNLGNPDEICNPRCVIARRSCRRGCD